MNEPLIKPATLRDVARLAGVSYQTVSRYINNHPNISSKSRLAVQKAIEELNFKPNRLAQALNTGRSRTLQIITFDLDYYKYLLSGLLQTSSRLGYQTAFSAILDPSSDDELDHLMNNLAGRAIDGFIWLALLQSHTSEQLAQLCGDIPFVIIGANPGVESPSVVMDQGYGVQMALQHLCNLGHRKIAEISGWLDSFDGISRHTAYLEFMNRNQLPACWVPGLFSFEDGYQGVKQLMAQGAEFTALLCGNDKTAIGAIYALHELGLRVPQDVSVIGYDDTPGMDYHLPPLTTIRQDFQTLGQQAVEYLVTMLENPGTPVRQRVLYPQLVVRGSTGKP